MTFLTYILMPLLMAGTSCGPGNATLHLNMPIILGESIFNDQVSICKKGGKYFGSLTVPKRFTSKLENIKWQGNALSFSITADEGRGKFQVHYKGQLQEDGKFFMGIAKLDRNKTLGPFIGVSSKKKLQFKVIQ